MNTATYFQIIGSVFLLCAFLVFAAWGIRRLQKSKGANSTRIKVKAIRSLTYKAQLALVEVEGEEILIGLGEGGPRLICRLEKRDARH